MRKIFLNEIMLLIYFIIISCFIISYTHKKPKKYIGVVIEVSDWDGSAKIKTKSSGNDTIIKVIARRNEEFVIGQIITVWTGGDLIGAIGTTKPQK